MFYVLVLLSLLTSNIYDVAAVTLNSTLLTQLGYNNQSSSITINGKNITNIDPNAFKGYTNVTSLNLASNAFTKLDLSVFQDLTNLQSIFLSDNPLAQLTNTKKIKFPLLQMFISNKSPLTSLDSNVVNAFPNLTLCDFLFGNQLSPLKINQLSSWKKLHTLTITTKNQISLTKAHFNGLNALESLSFYGSGIKTIEVHTFLALPNLKSVELTYNALTSFEYLQIPEKLILLILSGNKMNYFRLSRTMVNLKYLFLDINRFRSFKSMDFSFLTNLEILSLSYNPHAYPNEIPSHLKYLVNLKVVYLRNLSISNIDSNYFKKNINLNTIDLGANKISMIEAGAFHGMTNLQYIILDMNNLTQLDSSLFGGLNNLLCISLYDNPNLKINNPQSLCPTTAVNCKVNF